jgi:hypothetical protein
MPDSFARVAICVGKTVGFIEERLEIRTGKDLPQVQSVTLGQKRDVIFGKGVLKAAGFAASFLRRSHGAVRAKPTNALIGSPRIFLVDRHHSANFLGRIRGRLRGKRVADQ